MGATRLASGKYATFIWQSPYFLPFSIPTRDASPPLEVALGGSVSGNLKCPQNDLVLDAFFEHPTCALLCGTSALQCKKIHFRFVLRSPCTNFASPS